MKNLIDWFLKNPVAAQLLMGLLLIGGFIGSKLVHKEVFPSAKAPVIQVSMLYPGASPKEVEEQITIRIEESVADLEAIEKITSKSEIGNATVWIQLFETADVNKALNEVKSRIDRIITFPRSAERPVVFQVEERKEIMYLALHGNVTEAFLKKHAESIKDGLALVEGVSQVDLTGLRAKEISIEISESTMRRFNLSFDVVAQAIRGKSVNIPAGMIRSESGNVQIQTRSQSYTVEDFENIIIVSRRDGMVIRLKDIAVVRDGYEEVDRELRINDQRAVVFIVVSNENADIIKTTERIKAFIEHEKEILPAGLNFKISFEMSSLFEDRMGLLMENAVSGLILVFIVLMLFLRPILAVWVCVGIVVSFSGAIFMLPFFDVSLNMLSLFAFLLVLGIVVDDAIIVSESIYSRHQKNEFGKKASSSGAALVSKPVIIAATSTIIFFLPLMMVPEFARKLTYPIVAVIAFSLLFSLVECLLIMPMHLSHLKPESKKENQIQKKLSQVRAWFSRGLNYVAEQYYKPVLKVAIIKRSSTISLFFVSFILSIAIIIGGWITPSFMPVVPNDYIQGNVSLPKDAPAHEVRAVVKRMENAIQTVQGDEELLSLNHGNPFIKTIQSEVNENTIQFFIGLEVGETRKVSPEAVTDKWREEIGSLPQAQEYSLDYSMNGKMPEINFNLSISSNDWEDQNAATQAVVDALSSYPGVFNVRSALQGERSEIEIEMLPKAEMLGITLQEVASQIRQGYYGEEIQRVPIDGEDVRVMLRYPYEDRKSLNKLSEIRIRTKDNQEIPFSSVANVKIVPGFSVIDRLDRKRNISISAEVEKGHNADHIVGALLNENTKKWRSQFHGFSLAVGEVQQQQQEFISTLLLNFMLAMCIIYCLIAISFKSYWQPWVVMTAIPFGFVGAVIGHIILGLELSMMSMLGFVACAGVVINDNLVLLDGFHRLKTEDKPISDVVLEGSLKRFRPIVLTSITTFVGLIPLMFEQSVQAKYLIPMVASLAFGVLFATLVTLILVPCLYLSAQRSVERVARFKMKMSRKLRVQADV